MINVKDLLTILKKNNINFFTGVPDSVLSQLSAHLDNNKSIENIITGNEGSAVALAVGHFLAKKKIPCVYMQNSGLGNAINPLASITHPKVYSIPLLLIIGWRGSPFRAKDEPQHEVKGKITKDLLKLLNIKSCVLRNLNDLKKLQKLIKYSETNNRPVCCLIERKTLLPINKTKNKDLNLKGIQRSHAIETLLNLVNSRTRIISTTGYTSRELNQIRIKKNFSKSKDFYMVGGMGHASLVAFGYAKKKNNQTICLDGDGSLFMHLGALQTIGSIGSKNFKHILFNNGIHESVGGQKIKSDKINFKSMCLALGYKNYFYCDSKNSLKYTLRKFILSSGPSFLNIKIQSGYIKNLSRPNNFQKIKKNFIR